MDGENILVQVTAWIDSVGSAPIAKGDPIPAIKTVHGRKLIWLLGVETSDPTSESEMTLDGMFAVTGTKTYNVSGGSSTVHVLERIDPEPYEEKFTRRTDRRCWTAKSGYTTETIFVRYDRSRVTLMSVEGKTKNVRLSDLNDTDRRYVRDQVRSAPVDR